MLALMVNSPSSSSLITAGLSVKLIDFLRVNLRIVKNQKILITFGRNLINDLILEVKNENQKAKKTLN